MSSAPPLCMGTASGSLTLMSGPESPWAPLSLPRTSPGSKLSWEVLACKAAGHGAGATLGKEGSDSGGVTTQRHWVFLQGMGFSQITSVWVLYWPTLIPPQTAPQQGQHIVACGREFDKSGLMGKTLPVSRPTRTTLPGKVPFMFVLREIMTDRRNKTQGNTTVHTQFMSNNIDLKLWQIDVTRQKAIYYTRSHLLCYCCRRPAAAAAAARHCDLKTRHNTTSGKLQ